MPLGHMLTPRLDYYILGTYIRDLACIPRWPPSSIRLDEWDGTVVESVGQVVTRRH